MKVAFSTSEAPPIGGILKTRRTYFYGVLGFYVKTSALKYNGVFGNSL